MIHSLLIGVIGVLVGAFWGLIVALIIKRAGKAPKMPTWPLVTGSLLGLVPALMQMASDV